VRPSISLTNYGGGRTGLFDGPVQATRAVDQGGLDTVRVPDRIEEWGHRPPSCRRPSTGRCSTRSIACGCFAQHHERVRQVVPAERLLVYRDRAEKWSGGEARQVVTAD
jgi:hypothetical protein